MKFIVIFLLNFGKLWLGFNSRVQVSDYSVSYFIERMGLNMYNNGHIDLINRITNIYNFFQNNSNYEFYLLSDWQIGFVVIGSIFISIILFILLFKLFKWMFNLIFKLFRLN